MVTKARKCGTASIAQIEEKKLIIQNINKIMRHEINQKMKKKTMKK